MERNYTWTVHDKVKTVIFEDPAKDDLEFVYDAMGNRLMKIVKTKEGSGEYQPERFWTITAYVRDAQGNAMGHYNLHQDELKLSTNDIYRSSRIGNIVREFLIPEEEPVTLRTFIHKAGLRNYELSNHLGNVLSTVSDAREATNSSGNVSEFVAHITSTHDYYPFGMTMEGERNVSGEYRYGYQGSEMDNEIKDQRNSYSTHFRQLDVRIGRWLTIDPEVRNLPGISPYNSMHCNPIMFNDQKGDFIPLIIAGVVYFTAAEVAVVTTGVVVSTAVYTSYKLNQDVVDGIQNFEPIDWSKMSTSRGQEYDWNQESENYEKNDKPKGGGPKLAEWIIATGIAAVLAKNLYEGSGHELPKTGMEGESLGGTTPILITDEKGNPEEFIDMIPDGLKDNGDGTAQVTIKANLNYQVKRGDNLTKISQRYGVTIEQLVEWNNIEDPSLIRRGEVLKVGEATQTQTVELGEDVEIK